MREFEKLTHQGKLRRLRKVAEAALHELGFRDYPYRKKKLSCNSGHYHVRIHRNRKSIKVIESELDWLEALNRNKTLSVPQPYKSIESEA